MVEAHQIAEAVEEMVERDPRFARASYFFTHRAVRETAEAISKKEKGQKRQISGQELLEGIRSFAIDQFGPMALMVFHSWNVTCSRDFGEIVFNLAKVGILGVSEQDHIKDFENVYEFQDVFAKPFQPENRRFPRISLDQLEEGTLDISACSPNGSLSER